LKFKTAIMISTLPYCEHKKQG